LGDSLFQDVLEVGEDAVLDGKHRMCDSESTPGVEAGVGFGDVDWRV